MIFKILLIRNKQVRVHHFMHDTLSILKLINCQKIAGHASAPLSNQTRNDE